MKKSFFFFLFLLLSLSGIAQDVETQKNIRVTEKFTLGNTSIVGISKDTTLPGFPLDSIATNYAVKWYILNHIGVKSFNGRIGNVVPIKADYSAFFHAQGGNAYGAASLIGTTDNNSVQFIANNITGLTLRPSDLRLSGISWYVNSDGSASFGASTKVLLDNNGYAHLQGTLATNDSTDKGATTAWVKRGLSSFTLSYPYATRRYLNGYGNFPTLNTDSINQGSINLFNQAHTGDATGSTALTLATVNSNVGSFGDATHVPAITVNGKGLITAASSIVIRPAASNITGGAAFTKTDDTNVTMTVTGTPSAALLVPFNVQLGWTGNLAIARGGTNANTANQAFNNLAPSQATHNNSFLVTDGTNSSWRYIVPGDIASPQALTRTNDANVQLTLTGTPSASLLAATDIAVNWSGLLAVNRGGTNIGSYTTGDMLYASSSGVLSKLTIGTTGQAIRVVGGLPVWRDTLTYTPSWYLGGNTLLTDGVNNSIGTTDNVDFIIKRNNANVLRVGIGGNIGIGGTANSSAILDVQSATKGIRLPSGTGAQRNAITPVDGLIYYSTTSDAGRLGLYQYQTSVWRRLLTDYDSTAIMGFIDSAFVRVSFDTASRVLTMTDHTGRIATVIIPRGTASGASGITALGLALSGNTLTVSGDNGSSASQNFFTDNVNEGSRLYFTNARARLAVSIAKVPLSYNSATGVFDFDTTMIHTTNWDINVFQARGNYITALHGDGAATGPGDAAFTLSTVNSNTGTWGDASHVGAFTVNAKGLITAASSIVIAPAAGSITGGAALTKTDDANVTATLSGTPATALLVSANIALGWTGQLSVARGGTNISSYTTGDLLYASASGVISKLGIGTPGQTLHIVGGVPVWRDTLAFGGAGSYIVNGTGVQSTANFNISGNGTANTFQAGSNIQANGFFEWGNYLGALQGRLTYSANDVLIDAEQTGGKLKFRTNGTTLAMTIDNAQKVALNVTPSTSGSAGSFDIVTRNKTTGILETITSASTVRLNHYIGIGGNSNARGGAQDTSPIGDTTSDPRVLIWNNDGGANVWVVAHIGQNPFQTSAPFEYSATSAFYYARKMARETNDTFRIVNLSLGGTGLASWWDFAGSNTVQGYTTSFLTRSADAGVTKYDAMIFHLVENDGVYDSVLWKRGWDSVKAYLRRSVFWTSTTPFVMVGGPQIVMNASPGYQGKDPEAQAFDRNLDPLDIYANTDNVTTNSGSPTPHFDNLGLQKLGEEKIYVALKTPIRPTTSGTQNSIGFWTLNPNNHLTNNSGTNIGINVYDPLYALDVNGIMRGNSHIISWVNPSGVGAGARFWWNPAAGNLIAATATSTQLDSLGLYNLLVGYDNKILSANYNVVGGRNNYSANNYTILAGRFNTSSALDAVAFGNSNIITSAASGAVAMGYQNSSKGQVSFTMGQFNVANGGGSAAIGIGNTVNGYQNIALGLGLYGNSYSSVVVGGWNDTLHYSDFSPTGYSSLNNAFVVGNGIDNTHRSTAFTVKYSGAVGFHEQYGLPGNVLTSNGPSAYPTWKAGVSRMLFVDNTYYPYSGGGTDLNSSDTIPAGLMKPNDAVKCSWSGVFSGNSHVKTVTVKIGSFTLFTRSIASTNNFEIQVSIICIDASTFNAVAKMIIADGSQVTVSQVVATDFTVDQVINVYTTAASGVASDIAMVSAEGVYYPSPY